MSDLTADLATLDEFIQRSRKSIPDAGGPTTEEGAHILLARVALQEVYAPRMREALLAVVGRHAGQYGACVACSDFGGNVPYPCEDLRAIDTALNAPMIEEPA